MGGTGGFCFLSKIGVIMQSRLVWVFGLVSLILFSFVFVDIDFRSKRSSFVTTSLSKFFFTCKGRGVAVFSRAFLSLVYLFFGILFFGLFVFFWVVLL